MDIFLTIHVNYLYNTPIKLLKISLRMIDGLYPSQFAEIEAMKTSHYRNLKNIINKNTQHISHPSINFLHMSRHKKVNHENWKTFHNLQSQESRFKRNISLYDKLQVISNKRSRYAIKTQTSPPHDPLLHHNYLYECHRRYKNIDKNNSIIASKILKVKGDIDRKKQEADFQVGEILEVQEIESSSKQVCQSKIQYFWFQDNSTYSYYTDKSSEYYSQS